MTLSTALRKPGKSAQIPPARVAPGQGHNPVETRGQEGPLDADEHGSESAYDKLAGSADIKQAGFKGKAHGQAGHDDGRGEIEHLAQAVHAAREAARRG